jgi:tetratricopeptide (TPR) repeat protein
VLDNDNINIVTSLHRLTRIYEEQGRYEEAETLFLQEVERQKEVFGNDFLICTGSLTGLAHIYEEQGRYKEAETLYLQGCGLNLILLREP